MGTEGPSGLQEDLGGGFSGLGLKLVAFGAQMLLVGRSHPEQTLCYKLQTSQSARLFELNKLISQEL